MAGYNTIKICAYENENAVVSEMQIINPFYVRKAH